MQLADIRKLISGPGATQETRRVGMRLLEQYQSAPSIPDVIQSGSRDTGPQALRDAAGEVVEGLSFGMADELASFGDPQALAGLRSNREQFRGDNPALSLGLDMAGTLNPVGGPMQLFKQAMPVARNWRAGPAALAAAEGGLAGYGYSDDPSALSVGGPAAISAALPIAGNLIKDVAGPPLETLWNHMFSSSQGTAKRKIKDLLKQGDMSDAEIIAEKARLGPDATLADIVQEPGTAALQQMAGTSDSARAKIARFTQGREAGANARINRALTGQDLVSPTAAGRDVPLDDVIEHMVQVQRGVGKTMYKQALDEPLEFTPELLRVLDRPHVRKAIDKARNTLVEEGRTDLTKVKDMEVLQIMQQHLYDAAEATRDPLKRTLTREGRTLMDSYSSIRGAMESASPKYKAAQKAWASEQKIIEAANEGRKVLQPNSQRTRRYAEGLNQDELDAYELGILETFQNKSGRGAPGQMRNFNFLEGENVQDVLREVLPKERADKITNMMDAERRYGDLRGRVLRGSQTAFLQKGAQTDLSTPLSMAANWAKKTFGKMTDEEANTFTMMLLDPNGVKSAVDFASSKGASTATKKWLRDNYATITTMIVPAMIGKGAGGMQQ